MESPNSSLTTSRSADADLSVTERSLAPNVDAANAQTGDEARAAPLDDPLRKSTADALPATVAHTETLPAVVSHTETLPAPTAQSADQSSRPDPNSPSRIEIILGLGIMASWLFLLAVGTLYNSTVYGGRLHTLTQFNLSEFISIPWFFLLYVLTYTMTNTLLLCVLAAALGQAGRRDRIDGDDAHPVQSRPGQYFGAMLRGFMTYLFVVSGSVVIANKTFDDPTRQDYLTFATTVSVLGFLAGYNPEVFVRFMNGIRLSVQPQDKTGSSKLKPAGGAAPNSTNPTG